MGTQRSLNNCQRVHSTNCCVTKSANTDGKGADPQTQSLVPIPNDNEEYLFISSPEDGIFTETLSGQPSNNDEEDMVFSKDGEKIFSNPIDDIFFSPLDPLIASTGDDNTLPHSTKGQGSNEEIGLFSLGR